jgi:hypothetical protein
VSVTGITDVGDECGGAQNLLFILTVKLHDRKILQFLIPANLPPLIGRELGYFLCSFVSDERYEAQATRV